MSVFWISQFTRLTSFTTTAHVLSRLGPPDTFNSLWDFGVDVGHSWGLGGDRLGCRSLPSALFWISMALVPRASPWPAGVGVDHLPGSLSTVQAASSSSQTPTQGVAGQRPHLSCIHTEHPVESWQ